MVHPAQVLQDRLIEFAVRGCQVAARLPRSQLGFHLSRQLFRSCTSPAPNYGEAQSAESRQDFVHKMRICLKELREAQVWLRMIQRLHLLESGDVDAVLEECGQLVAIFTSSVVTASKGLGKPGK
jgi:four helix bundle protein